MITIFVIIFADFIFYWALAFFVTTTVLLICKKEDNSELRGVCDERRLGIGETYLHLWKILKIRSMQLVGLFLLTRLVSRALNSFRPTWTFAMHEIA